MEAMKAWYHEERRQVEALRAANQSTYTIWAGNFNRHHPFWENDANHHLFTTTALQQAQPLLNLLHQEIGFKKIINYNKCYTLYALIFPGPEDIREYHM
jgi:hypothetical protein